MKKAMIFAAAAFAAATVLNPLTAEAAGTNRAAVVYKGSVRDWTGQSAEWKDISGCFKWGTIFWKDECLQQPKPEAPEEPEEPEESPEVPKPEAPEAPETPETPEESPEAPEQSPSEDETENKTFEEQVAELVNVERGKEGLAPLTMDKKIEAAAAVRAKEIQKSFSHTRPNGSGFSTALKEAGATYKSAGENIAWGQKTPEEVVKAWMNSPGHRANIMNKKYSRIGVSHAKNAQGTSYWAQLFAD